MPRQIHDLRFPVKGFVENSGYSNQPDNTTPDVLNMRPFDAIDRRLRGGQRTGIQKYLASSVNGSARVQTIYTTIEASPTATSAAVGDKFAEQAPSITGTGADVKVHPDGDVVFVTINDAFSHELAAWPWSNTTGFGTKYASFPRTGNAGFDPRSLAVHPDGNAVAFVEDGGSLVVVAFDKGTGFNMTALVDSNIGLGDLNSVDWHPSGTYLVVGGDSSPHLHAYSWNGTTIGSAIVPGDIPSADVLTVRWSPDGARIAVHQQLTGVTSILVYTWTGTAFAASPASPATAAGNVNGLDWHPSQTYLAACSNQGASEGFRVWPWDNSTNFGVQLADPSLTGTGTRTSLAWRPQGNALMGIGQISGGSNFLEVFDFADEDLQSVATQPSVAPTITIPSGFGGTAWSPDGSVLFIAGEGGRELEAYQYTPAQTNLNARSVNLVVVSGGNIYRTNDELTTTGLVNSGAGAVASGEPVRAQQLFNAVYFVDGTASGYKVLNLANNTVSAWTPTDGALPVGSSDATKACRFIQLYRGRIALAGLEEEPQNWFLSRAGDGLNWDYAPTTINPLQAVAGNNSNAGQLGDIVTALAPYQDDIMIMGGANSLWIMNGDPASGGEIDNISRRVGIVGPDAWTYDSDGNFYFFWVNGLYRIQRGGGAPELVSKGKIDKEFANVDTSNNFIRLAYDPVWQGVHIFISPPDQPVTSPTHYWYDERTDSFWRDEYPAVQGPSAIGVIYADDPQQTAILLGGYDSFIRDFRDTALDDDGTAIGSRVIIPAFRSAGVIGDTKLSELHFNLDDASGDVMLTVQAGQTVEQAVETGDVRFTRTLVGGRSNAVRQRARGNAIVCKLEKATTGSSWAYESGGMVYDVAGKARRRRR